MKRLLTIALFAAATTVAVSGAQAGFGAKTCKSWVSGTGSSVIKATVKMKARINWVQKTKAAYGTSYAKFSKAKNVAFSCNTVKVQGKWLCTVRAKPCKSVGLKSG